MYSTAKKADLGTTLLFKRGCGQGNNPGRERRKRLKHVSLYSQGYSQRGVFNIST